MIVATTAAAAAAAVAPATYNRYNTLNAKADYGGKRASFSQEYRDLKKAFDSHRVKMEFRSNMEKILKSQHAQCSLTDCSVCSWLTLTSPKVILHCSTLILDGNDCKLDTGGCILANSVVGDSLLKYQVWYWEVKKGRYLPDLPVDLILSVPLPTSYRSLSPVERVPEMVVSPLKDVKSEWWIPDLPRWETDTYQIDFESVGGREQSIHKFKTSWESIFEKYGKDFGDESDEIVILSGEIVVDKGSVFIFI